MIDGQETLATSGPNLKNKKFPIIISDRPFKRLDKAFINLHELP